MTEGDLVRSLARIYDANTELMKANLAVKLGEIE